jgi:hypothetical protein
MIWRFLEVSNWTQHNLIVDVKAIVVYLQFDSYKFRVKCIVLQV